MICINANWAMYLFIKADVRADKQNSRKKHIQYMQIT